MLLASLQVLTGVMRTKALEAKQSNFSLLHRVSDLIPPRPARRLQVASKNIILHPIGSITESEDVILSSSDSGIQYVPALLLRHIARSAVMIRPGICLV